MDWLEEKGIAENTLVLVVSDHGEMVGEHGKGGKKSYFRNSMQVPMIVRYPEGSSGGRVAAPLPKTHIVRQIDKLDPSRTEG